MAVRREYIADLYRNVLGREGSEGEISGWENSPDESSVSAMFYGSPEYTSKHGGQASWNDVGGVITPAASQPQSTYQTQGGGYDDPGFPGGGIITDPGTNTGGGTKTDVGGSVSDAVTQFYQKYLGRAPGANDVNAWLSGAYGWGDQNNLAGIERGIQTSEEASRRRAATPTTSYDPKPYTNFETGGNDYSAFNTGRQQDPGKSAKDAFAMISNQAPPPPFGSKAQMAQWFNTYVRPGMDSLGHKVSDVSEDGFWYSNHEGSFFVDFGQNSGGAPGSGLQRLQWNATPADDATRQRYATTGGGGASANPRSTSGTMQDIRSLYQNLGQMYGGPGSPGVFNGPVQQVGQDPLSYLITGGLADFLERGGTTPFGSEVQDAVMGRLDGDNPNIARRFESARELMDKGRRTQTNDARAALANRGLLSEPGIPQGAEIGAIKRIEENIAPEFSRALRDIYTDETTNALTLATGMASDQAKQFLAGIGEGTARQTALANIALQSLGQNMAWNQFLAEFGLKRDQVLNELQNGRVDDVMQLLNAFMTSASMSSRGYVGA